VFTLDSGAEARSVTVDGRAVTDGIGQDGDRVSIQLPQEIELDAGQGVQVEIEI